MSKNYIKGWIKEITTKFWPMLKLSLSIEDLNNLPKTEKGYIKLVIAPRKEVWQYGDTHYMYEDDFSPIKEEDKSDEIPF